MKILKYLPLAFLGLFLGACTSSTKSKNEKLENTSLAKENCMYSYVPDSTSLKWEAYKFMNRVAVSGTFTTIDVTGTKTANKKFDVFVGAKFSIHTASVNSNDASRDDKLVKFFFDKLTSTGRIKGEITSINSDEASISIRMNNKKVDVIGKVMKKEEKIILSATIDLNDFNGIEAINSLNEACADLHKGADKKSKLWPDITIIVSTVLKKECS